MTEAALAGVPPGYRCETCGFELWLPIAELSCSTLGLYDDARFPGRCLLVLHEHVEDLTTLPTAIAHHFLDDLRAAERAIRVVTGAGRDELGCPGQRRTPPPRAPRAADDRRGHRHAFALGAPLNGDAPST